ncbi:uncharacterized protein C2845_PM08G04370 [Panicum miliaceum]|uniref:Uncharacterized protein n=1 Tax=Panicum miliaceum TaxID=4540 RepID=A0A3L6QYV2_PANMI|nr:uncharacterized protein C2845_PM08G04370 [Panicum miliaceum]
MEATGNTRVAWFGRAMRSPPELKASVVHMTPLHAAKTQGSFGNSKLFSILNELVSSFTDHQKELCRAVGFGAFANGMHEQSHLFPRKAKKAGLRTRVLLLGTSRHHPSIWALTTIVWGFARHPNLALKKGCDRNTEPTEEDKTPYIPKPKWSILEINLNARAEEDFSDLPVRKTVVTKGKLAPGSQPRVPRNETQTKLLSSTRGLQLLSWTNLGNCWARHDVPKFIEITARQLVQALGCTNEITMAVCDAYFRVIHQDDLAARAPTEKNVWRHFLETDFAARVLAGEQFTDSWSIRQQFIGQHIEHNITRPHSGVLVLLFCRTFDGICHETIIDTVHADGLNCFTLARAAILYDIMHLRHNKCKLPAEFVEDVFD